MKVQVTLTLENEKSDDVQIAHVLRTALASYVEARTPVDRFIDDLYPKMPPDKRTEKIQQVTERVLLAKRIEANAIFKVERFEEL